MQAIFWIIVKRIDFIQKYLYLYIYCVKWSETYPGGGGGEGGGHFAKYHKIKHEINPGRRIFIYLKKKTKNKI